MPVVVNVVVYEATPPLMVAEPKFVVPSLNVTVPVAVDGVIDAVRTLACPTNAGFTEDVSVVDVVARLTV